LKIILTKDFENLGSLGDILEVKDGYANNFLIPREIAVCATKGNIKQMEIVKKSVMKKEAKNVEEAKQIAERLENLELSFKVKTSSEGKLYGSVTSKDIADRIFKERKVEIDKKKIEFEGPLKEVGSYDVVVRLYKDVKSNVKVTLEGDSKSKEGKEKSEAEDLSKEKDEHGKDSGNKDETGDIKEPAKEKDVKAKKKSKS